MTPEEALQFAKKACGTEAELCRRIGMSQQAVNQWKRVPADKVLIVEEATGGQVSRHDLRPDIFGAVAA